MITCTLMGGLGNQLFQIYFVLSYALNNKLLPIVRFPKELPDWDKRHTYWDTIFKSISFSCVIIL